MALTLAGPIAKIAHAQHHLKTLKDEIETWVQRRPYAVTTEHKPGPETHTWIFTLDDVFDAPDELGLIFGDYIHNLRSGLDQLVWALAVNNKGGKEPANAEAVGFPVAANPTAFYDAPVLRNLTWEQEPNTKIACITAIPSGSEPDVKMKEIPVEVAFGDRRRIRDDDIPRLRDVTGNIFIACKRFF